MKGQLCAEAFRKSVTVNEVQESDWETDKAEKEELG